MCVARDEVGHSSHRLGLVGSVIPRLARSLTLARRRWSKRVLQRHGHECDPATRECSVWHIDHEEQLLATAQLDAEVAEALQRAELEALLRKGVHPLVLGIACAHTAQSCEAEEDSMAAAAVKHTTRTLLIVLRVLSQHYSRSGRLAASRANKTAARGTRSQSYDSITLRTPR